MNGLIYGATENIFGVEKIAITWPFSNVVLAVGFAVGPPLFDTDSLRFNIQKT